MSKEILHCYQRISTRGQEDNFSIEDQKTLGEEYAARLGFEIQHWTEGVASASDDDLANRPELFELLDEVSKGLVKHIYVRGTPDSPETMKLGESPSTSCTRMV